LRRSAIDLPRETAEQAAALRRTVEEQIKALQDLTAFINRTSIGHDVVEAAPPRRNAPDVPAPAEAVARPAPRPAEPRPAAPAPASTSGPAAGRPAARPAEPARPADPTPRTPTVRPTGPAERGPGWLSDLLARASRDEEPAPSNPPPLPATRALPPARLAPKATAPAPAPAPALATPAPTTPARQTRGGESNGSLASLSFDIGKLINETALTDAWEQFRRGQQDSFTAALYTAQGQQTFDEVRRRFRSDRDFTETVNRYTVEFERLLAEVGRDDRDGEVTRSYLLSETGKVYTLLAHAAGRLD
jgi:hypothetical protein